MPALEAKVSIRCPVDKVFDFLINTENLPKIIPDELKLKVVNAPPQLALGSRMEFQILAFGPPQSVVYEVTEFARPHRFIETQVKGMLPRYVHEHILSAGEDGHVLLVDRIEFEPPGGLLGFMLTADRLRTSLQSGLVHRHNSLKRHLEAGT
jgi:ligand-binding SRPBCC domain-containing protein